MFNTTEKVVLTLLTLFIMIFIVALGLMLAGFKEAGESMLMAALAAFGVGALTWCIAFVKWLWFDA